MYVKAPTDWHVVTSTLPKKLFQKKIIKSGNLKRVHFSVHTFGRYTQDLIIYLQTQKRSTQVDFL